MLSADEFIEPRDIGFDPLSLRREPPGRHALNDIATLDDDLSGQHDPIGFSDRCLERVLRRIYIGKRTDQRVGRQLFTSSCEWKIAYAQTANRNRITPHKTRSIQGLPFIVALALFRLLKSRTLILFPDLKREFLLIFMTGQERHPLSEAFLIHAPQHGYILELCSADGWVRSGKRAPLFSFMDRSSDEAHAVNAQPKHMMLLPANLFRRPGRLSNAYMANDRGGPALSRRGERPMSETHWQGSSTACQASVRFWTPNR
jgi:hypothetical protein